MTKRVILACGRVLMGEPLLLPDNLTGRCDTCGHRVQYRPHAPRPHTLRCMACVAMLLKPEDEFFTTRQMIEDALAHKRRREH